MVSGVMGGEVDAVVLISEAEVLLEGSHIFVTGGFGAPLVAWQVEGPGGRNYVEANVNGAGVRDFIFACFGKDDAIL
jgi:hypothetical protein